MGGECILFSYAVGSIPLFYGLYVLIVGEVYISSFSKEPRKGGNARELGWLTMLVSLAYFIAITWAWSKYDR